MKTGKKRIYIYIYVTLKLCYSKCKFSVPKFVYIIHCYTFESKRISFYKISQID